jgi:Repair protein Rad1/Rec1/Rad17
LQGIIYFKLDFFNDYNYFEKELDHISFGVNSLYQFTDFLNAFIDNESSTMKMIYYGSNRPIVFVIQQTDDGPAEECDEAEKPAGVITTEYFLYIKDSFDPTVFSVEGIAITSKIVVTAKFFLAVIEGFDKQAKGLKISIDKDKTMFNSVQDLHYSTSIELKCDNEAFQVYDVTETTSMVYDLKSIRFMIKNITLAENASLQTLSNGVLKVFLNVKSLDADKTDFYIEFNLTPFVPDDD